MSKGTTLQEKVTKFDTLLGKPEREDAKRKIKCPKCGSENVIKRGTYETKNGKVQRYECKECDLGRFNDKDNGFRKMENRPEIITLALDLYFKGLSYRKIADHLNQFYHLDAEHTTIYYWVKKYSKFLKNFADELIPEVSGEWQSDEMAVNVNGEYKWLWNTIDEETRFLLVSSLSEARESEDAKRIFQEAKEKAEKKPDKITTDRLQAYIEGYKKGNCLGL